MNDKALSLLAISLIILATTLFFKHKDDNSEYDEGWFNGYSEAVRDAEKVEKQEECK